MARATHLTINVLVLSDKRKLNVMLMAHPWLYLLLSREPLLAQAIMIILLQGEIITELQAKELQHFFKSA